MADPLERQVLGELKKGTGKQNVLNKLETEDNRDDLVWYLNHLPTGKGRKDHQWINWLLIVVLLTLTVMKLYEIARLQLKAMHYDMFSPMLMLDLVVPAINFFVLNKIIRFQRQGYEFMTVLGVLALVLAENRLMPYLGMYLVIIGLSVFLLLRMFPKKERVKD
ncbi:MAG: hypothetical protein U9P36_06880 [Thermodesulfobacteriota bacterium]|nr:hypothetical protein [Thermodesulfobacteriota bacterium]